MHGRAKCSGGGPAVGATGAGRSPGHTATSCTPDGYGAGGDAASHRLLEFEHELIDRRGRPVARKVVCVVRMSPEIAFCNEAETCRLDFLAQRTLLDTMECLADRSALTRQGGITQHFD